MRAKRRTDQLDSDEIEAAVDRLIAQRDRARDALHRYGRHDTRCVGRSHCTCGLQDVLDER